jgi:ABC-type microcin C transport system duplicated ATPase subunit YejF
MSLLPLDSQTKGKIILEGQDILKLDSRKICSIRGNRIGMIFQEPMTALNPVKQIGPQISESIYLHMKLTRKQTLERVTELMDKVGLPVSRFGLNLYPNQLSGGQRQRVMIAMAIACNPDILIADEPTTALDVTVQEQILDLIRELADSSGMALIMISHDLGAVFQGRYRNCI